MAGKDIIMISQEELKRLHVIHKALSREIKQGEAAEIPPTESIGGARQVRRLIKRVKEEGDSGIRHKSRGRPSNRRLPEASRDKAINLYRKKYADFSPTLAAEKLLEIHNIKISERVYPPIDSIGGHRIRRHKENPQRQSPQKMEREKESFWQDGSFGLQISGLSAWQFHGGLQAVQAAQAFLYSG